MLDIFEIGAVLKIFYIAILKTTKKKKKKTYNFIGLCTNKKGNFLTVKNNFKGEKIIINFEYNSPIIVKITVLKIYPKIFYRVSRLFFLKKINRYFDDYKNKKSTVISNLSSFRFDYFRSAFLKKRLIRYKKKLKKFRKKYSYTENWKNLKLYNWEKKDWIVSS